LNIRTLNTLKIRLVLSFGILILAATVVGTWAASDLAVNALRKSTGQNLQEVAVQLRDKIELDLHERYSDLAVAAALSGQQLAKQQTGDVSALLSALAQNFSSYAWIGLTSADGTVLASTGDMLKGMNVAHRPWFQEARDKPYLGDAHKAVLLEEKLNNNSNTPLRFVDVAVPLQDAEGNFTGVLGAHLYLDWVASLGESLLAPLQQRLQAELILADKNGVVIVGPEDSVGRTLDESLVQSAQSDHPGYMTLPMAMEEGASARDFLVGYSRLRDRPEYTTFNWLVLVRKPASEAFQPAQSLRNTLIVSGVLLALLLIVFAIYTARRTTRPLLQMAREADRLDPGNPSSPIQLRDDYEEVRVLSSVLRDLVQRLTNKTHQMNELNASLEHRVAERTRALEEANQRLEETVRTDELTGLNNRRFFFELGQTALKKAIRSDKPMSAIMFDADMFKKVNDTYGHAVGDKALIHLSVAAQEALRDTDILARLGGEEFAVLLENTDEDAASEVAERLRQTINDKPLSLERGQATLSISAGVACLCPEGGDDLDTLLVLADKALYAAKSGGRNRVTRYSHVNVENTPPDE
jgi:diguanylate cyclase (GGDEF)-like protein